jgi:hypothetical protein
MRGFYSSFTDYKSDLQTIIVTYKQVKKPLRAQLGEQFKGSSYYTRYIFPLYFYSLFAAINRTHSQFKALFKRRFKGQFKRNFLIHSFMFSFMVL